jgi:hypothetical protein
VLTGVIIGDTKRDGKVTFVLRVFEVLFGRTNSGMQ